MAAAQGKYVSATDLINRITPQVYLAMFDDENTGEVTIVNDAAVQLVIDEAEGEVDSYLLTERGLPLPALVGGVVDRLVKLAVLDFAEVLSYRHPEYIKTYGESAKADALWERAEKRMERVRSAIQRLPDVDQAGGKPANVGGIIVDDGPRTILSSADGTSNLGDF